MAEQQTKFPNNIISIEKHRPAPSKPSEDEFDRNYINANIGIDYLNNLKDIIYNKKFPPDLIPELKYNLTEVKNAIDEMYPAKGYK